MYYIAFNKTTKRVVNLSVETLPKQSTDFYGEAEFYGELPNKYDYLTITNLQEKTNTWTEKEQVEKLDEQGNTIFTEQGEIVYEEIEVPKSRTYFTCDLVANFRLPLTAEQVEKQKQAKYESLCQQYIREKYSATDENKVVREYLADMYNTEKRVQFDEYNAYVESCKVRAKGEIYD